MRVFAKLISLTLLCTASAFAASSQTAVLAVQNLTCSLCLVTLQKALQQVPGVEQATVDFAHKTATVKFDPAKADTAALAKASTDAGFPATLEKRLR